MAKLALAAEDASQLGFDQAVLLIDRRTAGAAFQQLGAMVLVYRRDADIPIFYGLAWVAAVEEPQGQRFVCRLRDLTRFESPVVGSDERGAPGARRMIALSDERHAEIAEMGQRHVPTGNVQDVMTQLGLTPPVDNYLATRAELLERWGFRCAFTGIQFDEGEAPQLRMVPIQPRQLGGPLSLRNYLPMIELAERAWLTGGISLTDDLDVIAVQNRLDPDLLEKLPTSGRLTPPAEEFARPDPRYLAFHRAYVFGR